MAVLAPTKVATSNIGGTVGSVLFVGANNILQQNNANFFWDNTNNRLGLGTATPATTFDLRQTNGLATYTTSSGFTLSTPFVALINLTSRSTNNYSGLTFDSTLNLTSNPIGAYVLQSLNAILTVKSTDTAIYPAGSKIRSGTYGVTYNGTGSVPEIDNINIGFVRGGTGNITKAIGLAIQMDNTAGGGTVSQWLGIYIGAPTSTVGATFTNTAGLYIESQTPAVGTLTNTPYGLFQSGAGDINYFAGNVGIGITSPLRLLHVGGRMQLGGTATATTDWALTSGWGANATISAVTGTDSRGTVTVQTSALDTPLGNPVITLTFKDGTWTTTPFAVVSMNRLGTGLVGAAEANCTATTLVLEFVGTPTALTAATYIFNYNIIG